MIKIIKIIAISFFLSIVIYLIYLWSQSSNASLSPIPENGVKVIQIKPD